jgi:hypothetical protein
VLLVCGGWRETWPPEAGAGSTWCQWSSVREEGHTGGVTCGQGRWQRCTVEYVRKGGQVEKDRYKGSNIMDSVDHSACRIAVTLDTLISCWDYMAYQLARCIIIVLDLRGNYALSVVVVAGMWRIVLVCIIARVHPDKAQVVQLLGLQFYSPESYHTSPGRIGVDRLLAEFPFPAFTE